MSLNYSLLTFPSRGNDANLHKRYNKRQTVMLSMTTAFMMPPCLSLNLNA